MFRGFRVSIFNGFDVQWIRGFRVSEFRFSYENMDSRIPDFEVTRILGFIVFDFMVSRFYGSRFKL
jgi:hypothetical protein